MNKMVFLAFCLTMCFGASLAQSHPDLSNYPSTLQEAEYKMNTLCPDWTEVHEANQRKHFGYTAERLTEDYYLNLKAGLTWDTLLDVDYAKKCGPRRTVLVKFRPGYTTEDGSVEEGDGRDVCVALLAGRANGKGVKFSLRHADCFFNEEHYFKVRLPN